MDILYVKMGGIYSYCPGGRAVALQYSKLQHFSAAATKLHQLLSASAIFHTNSPLTTVKVRSSTPFSYVAEWQTQQNENGSDGRLDRPTVQ
jgi:hypothetical protein